MPAPYYPFDRTLRQSSALAGDGVTTVFGPSDFEIVDILDVEVWWKRVDDDAFLLCGEVSVEKTGDGFSTFTITFFDPPAATTEFYYQGRRMHERSTAIAKSNRVDLAALDYELSKIGIIQQEHYREIGSAIKAAPGVTPPTLMAELVAGNVLAVGPGNTLVDSGVSAAQVVASANIVTIALAAMIGAAIPLAGADAFGAIDDGVTLNKAAIDAMAAANNNIVYLPGPGVYKYDANNSGGAVGGKRFHGEGVVQTGINRHARNFAALTAEPANYGDSSSVETAFNGDFSRSLFPMEYRVSGAATLTQPTTGYVQKPEAAGTYMFFYNSSGHNQALDWTVGRTGVAAHQIKVAHAGQGDVAAFTFGVEVYSTKAGATHFLAQPAGTILNGGVSAYVNYANIVLSELSVDDNGFDVNGSGHVVHMTRTNNAGGQEVFWRAFSILSNGSQDIDAGYMMRGKVKRGFDTSLADISVASLNMAADQKIVGNAAKTPTASANPAASGYYVWGTNGDATISYVSATSAWTFSKPVNLLSGQSYKINNVQVLGARDTGWAAMTGTANKASVYDVASVTLPQLAGRVAALQAALTTHGSIGA